MPPQTSSCKSSCPLLPIEQPKLEEDDDTGRPKPPKSSGF